MMSMNWVINSILNIEIIKNKVIYMYIKLIDSFYHDFKVSKLIYKNHDYHLKVVDLSIYFIGY